MSETNWIVSHDAREALWNALGRRPDELFVIASALTAAEERGRRAGIEAHIRDLEAIEKRLDEFVDHGGTFGGIRVVYEYVTLAIAALAPRDSGKEDRK